MYDATVGRFLQEDPIGFEAEDANLYRYVGNNPVTFVDPTGQDRWIMLLYGHGFILVEEWNAQGTQVVGYAQLHFSLAGHEVIDGFPNGASVYNSWVSDATQDRLLLDFYKQLEQDEKDDWWPGLFTPLNNCWMDAFLNVDWGGAGNPAEIKTPWPIPAPKRVAPGVQPPPN